MRFVPKKWKWQSGRDPGGYEIFPLFYFGKPGIFGMDAMLFSYKPHTSIAPHRDPLNSYSGMRYFKINLLLWRSGQGGEFHCAGPYFKLGPLTIFRPDIHDHWVTEVEGKRLLLSIGVKLP